MKGTALKYGKVLTALAVAGVAAASLSACASEQPAEDEDVTKLTIWGAQSTPQATKDILDAYADETGIEMEFVTIPDGFEANVMTKWTTGQRPDILFGQSSNLFLSQLDAKKNLQDLSDMPFVSKTLYGLADSGTLDGVHYTATTGFPSVFGVFYNKDVFAEAGVDVPETADEFATALDTFKADGIDAVAIAGGDTWTLQLPYITALTDAVDAGFVDDLNANKVGYDTSDAVIEALEWEKGLVDGGYSNADWKTATFADQAAKLQSGDVAMVIQASWMLPSLTGDTDNLGFFGLPNESGKVMWQTSNLTSIQAAKTGNEAQETAARDFIEWLTTGDGYPQYLEMTKEPSVIDGVADPEGVSPLQQEVAASFSGDGIPSDGMRALSSPSGLDTLISQLLIGSLTAEEVATQMQTTFVDNAKIAGIPGF